MSSNTVPRMTAAEAHLAELRAEKRQPSRPASDHFLDYASGEPGFTYGWVVFGPNQAFAEMEMRRQGYRPIPPDDAVVIPSCGGLMRVHEAPRALNQYQVFRVPIAYLDELAIEAARQRGPRQSLMRVETRSFEEQLAERKAAIAHLERLTSPHGGR